MKNFEKYIDKIARVSCVKEIFEDYRYYCVSCEFSIEGDCDCNKVKQWYLQEYQEPIQLTHDEYVILKNVPKEWKWIVRDKYDGIIFIFDQKPFIENKEWKCKGNSNYYLYLFKDLFQFIKWEDEEPYEIAKLIADYEKENEDE